MPGLKKTNGYADAVKAYDRIPKAVWAAIAVSRLTVGGDYLEWAEEAVIEEWWALYTSGVVPQKPTSPRPTEKPWEEV